MTVTQAQVKEAFDCILIALAPRLDANIGRNLRILVDYIQQHDDQAAQVENP